MGWLRFVGSLKLWVSSAKEPYKRDDILQKRPIISRSLLIVATPYDSVIVRHPLPTLVGGTIPPGATFLGSLGALIVATC